MVGEYDAALSVYPILENDETAFYVGIERDISREKDIDRAKSEFISVASHQLRTPMTGIKWVVERFLKKEKLSKKGREYMEEIHTATENLSDLVDSLLNISRIESAGGLSIIPESVELVSYLESFVAEMQLIAEQKGVTTTFDKHPEKMDIVTDANMLRNIVQSLVSNAIEYTPTGGSVSVSLEEAEKDSFIFTVKDTGIGIPKEEQPKMFEKFHRASNAQLVKTDGTGLGLYITKQAVETAGGRVSFRSEVGKGTTFYVELPKVVREKAEGKKLI